MNSGIHDRHWFHHRHPQQYEELEHYCAGTDHITGSLFTIAAIALLFATPRDIVNQGVEQSQ